MKGPEAPEFRSPSVRILIRAKTWGGMEGNNLRLAVRLARRGHEVGYTALGTGVYANMPDHFAREVAVEEIDWPWEDPVPFAVWYRMMRQRPADIVVLPKDWWSKGGLPMMAAARMVYDRVVTREHVSVPPIPRPPSRRVLGEPIWYRKHLMYGRLLSRLADRIICVSDTVRNRLVDGCAFSEVRTVTVYNGVDGEEFQFSPDERMEFRLSLGIPDSSVVYGAVGRIDCGTKRHQLSLSAFARLRNELPDCDLHFLLVGDGPDRERMVALATEFGVREHFTVAPFMASPRAAYSALDVFLMPSAFEAFGLALAEAMATERCVVAMGTEGIAEILNEPGIGHCVAPDDEEAFYAGMKHALVAGAQRRSTIGRAARKSVMRRFEAEQQFDKIIRHVLGPEN